MSDPIQKALEESLRNETAEGRLRNELAAIRGYAELITNRIHPEAKSYHWANSIINVETMSQTIPVRMQLRSIISE